MDDVRRRSFWYRQAAGEPSGPQIAFDILFGAVFPLICLVADPLVFRSDMGNGGLLGGYAVFSYVLIGGQILTLMAWLGLQHRLGKSGAWFAGPLAAGALFSGAVGLVLFPFSLIGLLVLLGALGFTPLLTCFVFLRNAIRAAKRARGLTSPGVRRGLLAAGLLCSILPAFAADRYAERATSAALERPEAVDGLALQLHLIDGDRVVTAYQASPEGPRRVALARLYRRLSGRDIQARVMTRSD